MVNQAIFDLRFKSKLYHGGTRLLTEKRNEMML